MPSPQESTYIQTNFLVGERRTSDSLSRETQSSCEKLTNYKVLKGGAIQRRPGIRVLNEFTDIDEKVKRFFSFRQGYIVLFEDNKLYFILGNERFPLEIKPYHSQRYAITNNTIPLVPQSVVYSMGDFAFGDVVNHIVTDEHSQINDVIEFGDRFYVLPERGLPFILYFEDDTIFLEPYFFDPVNLNSYDSLVRSIPFNNEKHQFKDVLYDNTDVPSGKDEQVRLIIGEDSNLDTGRCKAWLAVESGSESSAEKIDSDKMALDDFIGTPIIFNVLPSTPVPISLDFKNSVNTTDNTVEVVRDTNWDESTSYTTGLLADMNTAASVSSFSFDSTIDADGSVRGTKATLIRELLYGRRYMIIPYRKVLGSNSGLVDYSTVYPSATSTTAALTSIDVNFEDLDMVVNTVTDANVPDINVTSYPLSGEEELEAEFETRSVTLNLQQESFRSPDPFSRGHTATYYFNNSATQRPGFPVNYGDNYNAEANGEILPGFNWAFIVFEERENPALGESFSVRIDIQADFIIPTTSEERVTISFRLNPFYNPKGNSVQYFPTGDLVDLDNEGQSFSFSKVVNVQNIGSQSKITALFSTTVRIVDHGDVSDRLDVYLSQFRDRQSYSFSLSDLRINNEPYGTIKLEKPVLSEPVFFGGKKNETNLGYLTVPATDSIKPNVPANGRLANGVPLETLSWNSVVSNVDWRDKFIGAYISIPRDSQGELEKDQTKAVLVANPTFQEFENVDSVSITADGISELIFGTPVVGDAPAGQEDVTREFSLSSSNSSDLVTLVDRLMDAVPGRETFTISLRDGTNLNRLLSYIDIVPFERDENVAVGYNSSQNMNYLTENTASSKTLGTLDEGGNIEGSVNSPDVIAFGEKKVTVAAGERVSPFLLVKKGGALSSEDTVILTVGGVPFALSKVADSTLSEVEEFMEATPSRNSFNSYDSTQSVTITKGSDNALFQFAAAVTTARASQVYADCAIFEIGMPSPVKDGSRRTIGGADYNNKEVEVRQMYAAYPDKYESLVVFKENVALLQNDRVHFLYGNENRSNHLVKVLNGAPAEDIKELIIRAGYVPGVFSLGYPTVISEYLKNNTNLSNIFSSPAIKTVEDYLNSEGITSQVDYSKRAVDPKGRRVSLRQGASLFSGAGIFASSDFGLFSISAEVGRDPVLVHSQKFIFDLLVFNNKLVFITPDNLLVTHVQSRERQGLRPSYSGIDQVHLLKNVESIIYDHDRQLYLMNDSNHDIICATDFDTQIGGFGTWSTAEVGGAKQFRFLKLLSDSDGIKAVCRYRKYLEDSDSYEDRLAVVMFDDTISYDGTDDIAFTSSVLSNQLINANLATDSGLYQGNIRFAEVIYDDCDQIKVRFLADRAGFIEHEYIKRDVAGRIVMDVPAPIQVMTPRKGYNPRIEIIQDGLNDVDGTIHGFKMRGQIDGV